MNCSPTAPKTAREKKQDTLWRQYTRSRDTLEPQVSLARSEEERRGTTGPWKPSLRWRRQSSRKTSRCASPNKIFYVPMVQHVEEIVDWAQSIPEEDITGRIVEQFVVDVQSPGVVEKSRRWPRPFPKMASRSASPNRSLMPSAPDLGGFCQGDDVDTKA